MIAPEVKKVLRGLKPYTKTLIIIACAGIVLAITQPLNLLFLKAIIDSFQMKKTDGLISSAFALLGITFTAGIARYFHIYMMNMVAERYAIGLRHKLQQKFMRLNLTFHNSFQAGSGGLISRVLNDITVIQNGLRMFADFFREPLSLFFTIGMLVYLNWRLTATIIFVLPLVLLFLRTISKTIKVYSIKGQEDLERITATVKESLDGVRIIQSFNLEQEMSNRFEREANEFLSSRKKIHQKVEMAGPVTEFIATILILGIIVYMGFEAAADRVTLGDFVAYATALLQINGPIKKIQESYVRVQETVVAAQRAFSILEDPNEVPQSDSLKPFPKDWKTITYQNVSFSYGKDQILKNVNLTIHRGEMIAFVGASGSGKSTIVNLLERFFDPTQGEILIDQTPIREINLKDLRANVALVTQDVFLFSDTIERNIWAGDFSKPRDGVIAAAKSANAHGFIMRTPLGYENRVGDRGNLLSGGEKQRVSIARAIFKDSPILILDEATSALDSQSEVEVQKGLDELMQGKTAFVIAHRLSTISRAHKIVVMKAGEIVEVGTHQTLLQNTGEYHSLHQLQKL
jgi:ATP-binding cassette subfamily B protein/subfamily B ATP-binding cassette protein MsbA